MKSNVKLKVLFNQNICHQIVCQSFIALLRITTLQYRIQRINHLVKHQVTLSSYQQKSKRFQRPRNQAFRTILIKRLVSSTFRHRKKIIVCNHQDLSITYQNSKNLCFAKTTSSKSECRKFTRNWA